MLLHPPSRHELLPRGCRDPGPGGDRPTHPRLLRGLLDDMEEGGIVLDAVRYHRHIVSPHDLVGVLRPPGGQPLGLLGVRFRGMHAHNGGGRVLRPPPRCLAPTRLFLVQGHRRQRDGRGRRRRIRQFLREEVRRVQLGREHDRDDHLGDRDATTERQRLEEVDIPTRRRTEHEDPGHDHAERFPR